jgi:hypothetical protein
MSNMKFVVALGVVAAWVGLFACGSSGGASSCLAGAYGGDCFSCMQTSCGPELSTLESACSDYFSCVCPGGNLSCSANASSACEQDGNEAACASAGLPFGTCLQKNCETQCSGVGDVCDGGASSTTTCTGSASLDAGCTNGQLLSSCSTTTGGTTSCYYKVGSQQFECASCTDTTSCEQAANAACH